jgi:hypothetical protein
MIIIAIDHGEELFAGEDAAESERFIAMLGHVLAHPLEGLDPFAVITIRADSVDPLLQRVPQLGIDAPHMRGLPPLSPSAYRDVITRPAAVYARRVTRLDIEPELVEVLVAKAQGADALPLLAFTLQRMFDLYHKEQRLRRPQNLESSEARNNAALATSSAVPRRPNGTSDFRRFFTSPFANTSRRLDRAPTSLQTM